MYPAVPKGTPIYAVVDITKKKGRPRFVKEGSNERKSESNLPDLVTLGPTDFVPGLSNFNERHIRISGQVSNDRHDVIDITEDVNEENTEYPSDYEDKTLITSEEHSCEAMVKSYSANHSPNFDDLCVSENVEKVKHHKKKKTKKHKKEVTVPSLEHEINSNGSHPVQRRGKIV